VNSNWNMQIFILLYHTCSIRSFLTCCCLNYISFMDMKILQRCVRSRVKMSLRILFLYLRSENILQCPWSDKLQKCFTLRLKFSKVDTVSLTDYMMKLSVCKTSCNSLESVTRNDIKESTTGFENLWYITLYYITLHYIHHDF